MRALFISALGLLACGGRVDSPDSEGGAIAPDGMADVSSSSLDAALPLACPANAQSLAHWFLSGSSSKLYEGGPDATVSCNGEPSVSLRSTSQAGSSDFGTMMITENAAAFAGKRVRFRGWVQTSALDTWAGLWMRVDEPNNTSGAFDNMANRPIKGTTPWTQYDVVLDVASDATDIALGVLVAGNGEAWLDGVTIEVVDDSVPTTGS